MNSQKGSVVLISVLVGLIIIGVVGIYELQGGWVAKPTNSGYAGDIDQAKETQIKIDFKAIQTALESYRISKGQYPDSLDELVKVSALSQIPKNPYNNLDYDYTGTANTYNLSTKLGDGSLYEITN